MDLFKHELKANGYQDAALCKKRVIRDLAKDIKKKNPIQAQQKP